MRILLSLLVVLGFAQAALAAPRQIIILRHGEKLLNDQLCDIGEARAQALAKQYLGKGATHSLFAPGETPAGMLAITPHTIETISPSAASWGIPVTKYAIPANLADADRDAALDRQTLQAVQDVLTAPAYEGRVVVMTWEHKRIANKHFPENLRLLFGLDAIASADSEKAPAKWPGSTYDYFWIVDFQNGRPVAFHMKPQVFTPPYDGLPSNLWGEEAPWPAGSRCKGAPGDNE